MSRPRFTLLVALLAMVVSAGSFTLASSAFDDGEPDPPPERTGDGSAPTGDSSTTTTAAAVTTGDLPSPSYILVVSSDAADEAGALAIAEQVAVDGHPSGVLRSDDYPSLNRGFWVTYAGPYDDLAAAEAALAEVKADGWTSAYPRCAGTKRDCQGDEGDGNSDDEDD